MKMVVIVVVLLVLVGGVVGAGLMGVINIPGLTPKKKHGASLYGDPSLYGDASLYAESASPAAKKKPDAKRPDPSAKPPAKKKVDPGPTTDPEQGAKKLAKVWSEMETEKLVLLVQKGWTEKDIAEVLVLMDPAKAAEVIGQLKPDQASKVSKEMQKRASMLKPKGK